MEFTRRNMIKLSLGAIAATTLRPLPELFAQAPLMTRAVPSSGERIPIVGIGTRDYEAETPEMGVELKEVLRQFSELGGKVVDTAMDYRKGASETLVGELVSELGNRDQLFFSTKVRPGPPQAYLDRPESEYDKTGWKEQGIEQIERSFQRLRTDPIDLILVHNVRDAVAQLETLGEMKKAGRIRYVGVTTGREGQYEDLEGVMKTQPLDFVQVDYAVDSRKSGERILPLAADRGIAVMINKPFGYGRLFSTVRVQTLPDWVIQEADCKTWAQFFLKYILSNPAVTCAIPGTRRVTHLVDNLEAAKGRLPDTAMRRRMEQFMDNI